MEIELNWYQTYGQCQLLAWCFLMDTSTAKYGQFLRNKMESPEQKNIIHVIQFTNTAISTILSRGMGKYLQNTYTSRPNHL